MMDVDAMTDEEVLSALEAACEDTAATLGQMAAYELNDWRKAMARVALKRLSELQLELMTVMHERSED